MIAMNEEEKLFSYIDAMRLNFFNTAEGSLRKQTHKADPFAYFNKQKKARVENVAPQNYSLGKVARP